MVGCARGSVAYAESSVTLHEGFRDQLRWSPLRWVPFTDTADRFRFHDKCAREYRRWRQVLTVCAAQSDDYHITPEEVARAVGEYEEFGRAVAWHTEFGHFGGPLRVDDHLATPFIDTIVMS